MKYIVETKNVTKSFQMGKVKIEVLRGINLEILPGDFVSIMGPSGSGKSTLLYLLGALDKPSTGSVKIKGKSLSGMTDSQQSYLRRKELGFVFQFYNLIPNLTVEDNILLPVLLDRKRPENFLGELETLLELTGMADRRKHLPAQLSGGQQQRVAIARSLINSPDIILADEPTGNLDSKTGFEIMELLLEINRKKGKTLIQVTHSKDAARLGSKMIEVKDGKIWN